MEFIVGLFYAAANVARGRKLFNLTDSTVFGRFICVLIMALTTTFTVHSVSAVTFFLVGACLFIWCTFAWDAYWASCIGDPIPTQPVFPPVDWVMKKVQVTNPRLWGTIAMGLRQSLAAPAIVGLAIAYDHPAKALLGLLPLTFGLCYTIPGMLLPRTYCVIVGEALVGFLLGLSTYLASS